MYISDAQDKFQSQGQTKEEVSSAKAEVVFLIYSKLSFYCITSFYSFNFSPYSEKPSANLCTWDAFARFFFFFWYLDNKSLLRLASFLEMFCA
jgi:hypothetical protein